MDKVVLILGSIVLFLGSISHAREPNVLPRHYDYGGGYTMPDGEWGSGDTFLVIALPIAVVMVIALPHIFDGKLAGWGSISPTMSRQSWADGYRWPFPVMTAGGSVGLLPDYGCTAGKSYKFPTRSLCGSY